MRSVFSRALLSSSITVALAGVGPASAVAAPMLTASTTCSPSGYQFGTSYGTDTSSAIVGAQCQAFGLTLNNVSTAAVGQAGAARIGDQIAFNAVAEVDQQGSATAQAGTLDLFVEVELTAPPPFVPSTVPLIWDGIFSFGFVGSGAQAPIASASLAIARLTTSTPPVVAARISDAFDSSVDPPGASTLQVRFDYDLFRPDLAAEILLQAGITCFVPVGFGDRSCSVDLQTDKLRFDQATFDQRMGASTFALDDYFAIVFVPEPGTGLMVGLGLVAFAGRRRPGGLRD